MPFIVGAGALIGGALGAGAAVGIVGGAIIGGLIGGALALAIDSAIPDTPEQRRNPLEIKMDSAAPRRLIYGTKRAGGYQVYANLTDDNKYMHIVVIICDGPVEGLGLMLNAVEVTLDGNGVVQAGEFADKVRCKFHLGAADQAADATMISELPDWTSDHRLLGIAYAYLRFEYDEEIFPGGKMPDVNFLVQGRNDIYDPRTDTSGFTANSALIKNHFLTMPRMGPAADFDTEVDSASLVASANVCDEDISLDGGGTEKRYETHGAIDMDREIEGILSDLCMPMAGFWVYSGGLFYIRAGYYQAPDFTITKDMIVGKVTNSNSIRKKDRANTIKGKFRGPDRNYREVSFPARVSAAGKAADGEELAKEVDMPLINSHTQCQRVAQILLNRIRLMKRISFPATIEALKAISGQTVTLDFDELSASGVYLANSVSPKVVDGSIEVSLSLEQYDASIYSWSTLDEQSFAADALIVADSSIRSYTFNLYATVFSEEHAIVLSWDSLPAQFRDSFVEIEYKPSAETEWISESPSWVDAGSPSRKHLMFAEGASLKGFAGTLSWRRIDGLDPQIYWDFRVRLKKDKYTSGWTLLTYIKEDTGIFSDVFSSEFV